MTLNSNVPLTEQEYVDKLGLLCPNCKSTKGVHTWGSLYTDDGVAWQDVGCNLCNLIWVDNYNLVGYSELEMPEDND